MGATYRAVFDLLRPLARVTGWIALMVVLTAASIVLLPITLYLLVRWAFAVQAVAVEGRSGRSALARSAELVRGRWWRTGAIATAITVFGGMLGPLVGILLLLATTKSFLFVNAVSALVYVVTIPFVAVVLANLYYDARARVGDVSEAAVERTGGASAPRVDAPQSS